MSALPAVTVDVDPGPRWPLRPLLDASGLNRLWLAHHVRVSGETLKRAAHDGLTDTEADQWATRLGFHPIAIWGWDWIDAGIEHRPTTVLGQLIDQLRERIVSGELQAGDQLPSAAALGRAWGVSRNTAARVVAALVREGRLSVAGGGPQRRITVTTPAHICTTCAEPIEPDTEHYPHDPDCPAGDTGRCACDRVTHPECCSTCTGGPR